MRLTSPPLTVIRIVIAILFVLLSFTDSLAQEQRNQINFKKELQAQRIKVSPEIDGILDEEVWQHAQIATDFIQHKPNPGIKARLSTEVRVLYDDEAIYIGAIIHETSRDSILMQLGRRDDLGNTDFFGIFLDTYNDQINGFGFIITPAGIQLDARYSSNGEDFSWNAVWESSASIQGTDWVAEFRIPYSAIRFSSKPEQVWGINFMRNRRATRQEFFWNHVDPAKDGFVNHWGKLTGLKAIEAPLRLSFTPYVSAFGGRYPKSDGSEAKSKYDHEINFGGGMDVKYGISDAFTLDVTLIPDFSQVQSDNQILNLSPFEVQFNENRPFFLEGTELFNKGGFLYSRRIGGTPVNYLNESGARAEGNRIIGNPSETKMINGTKVSGRTKSGLGIGIFNAVVGRSFATLEDTLTGERFEKETQPLTNYNIFVLDQSLKNNSFVTVVNTNVMRAGSTYDANLTGMLFRFANKANRYAINGKASVSQRYFTDETQLGHAYNIGIRKISGNFTFNASHSVESDTYNPNDLGILFTNNNVEENLSFSYRIFQPFWKILNLNTNLGASYSRRYRPDAFQNFMIYGSANTTFKNFFGVGVNINLEPVLTYDYFEPRVSGWYYIFPTNSNISGWMSSDYRKKFAFDLRWGYRRFDENNRYNFNYELSPRYRVNDKLSFVYSFSKSLSHDDMGFATNLRGKKSRNQPIINENLVLFGVRDRDNIANTLEADYIFNNRMSLRVWMRHNWSDVIYKKYYLLDGQQGSLQQYGYNPADYYQAHDQNFNTFNLDIMYSWWFAPGSEISIVWKDYFRETTSQVIPHYFDNVEHTLFSPRRNTLSIKVLYYIDYLTLSKRLKEK